MVTAVAAIGALLLSVAIMVMGNGLQGTLITVRANIEAFNAAEIGLLVSGYYAGFIAGCWAAPHMVVRVGHIRTFAAMSVIAAATILIYPIIVEPWVWWVMRAIAGLALAGLYTVIESWLNDRATNENRGALFSIYRAVDLSAMTAGLMLLNIAAPEGFELFSLAALLMSLALVPVAMTRGVAPAPVAAARLQLRRLYTASPLGVVGVFMVAMANAASMGLIPVFVQRSGFGVEAVAFAMAALVVGGALAQYPVGWLSDRFDRRSVVIVFTILAVLGGGGVAVVSIYGGGFTGIVAATAVFGAITMPLYSLLIAHVNDHLEPHEFVVASGGLLLIYGLGAVVGPLIASFVMLERPPWLLFAYTSTVFGVLVAYSLWRVTRRPPPLPSEQGDFVMPLSPLATPQSFELDPRADTDAIAEMDIMEPVEERPPVTTVAEPTAPASQNTGPEPEAGPAPPETPPETRGPPPRG
ncbi:Twin-arginine translocation pathway signal [Caenispirillum salinarum AK4]|uniref:Twin-arginine translocation pathway signal n=1 Tax=Caenispirillum salinarum AK4 TaxID=1238182 RepID=K9HBY9_9PROT|nr:MFS transporter [Caenispirillum salinarum]EKV26276.1 Twin-arginine translocation pathway signal [Caenispirillum salinarum AK4]